MQNVFCKPLQHVDSTHFCAQKIWKQFWPVVITIPLNTFRITNQLSQHRVRLPRSITDLLRFALRLPRSITDLLRFALRLPGSITDLLRFAVRLPRSITDLLRFALRLPSGLVLHYMTD